MYRTHRGASPNWKRYKRHTFSALLKFYVDLYYGAELLIKSTFFHPCNLSIYNKIFPVIPFPCIWGLDVFDIFLVQQQIRTNTTLVPTKTLRQLLRKQQALLAKNKTINNSKRLNTWYVTWSLILFCPISKSYLGEFLFPTNPIMTCPVQRLKLKSVRATFILELIVIVTWKIVDMCCWSGKKPKTNEWPGLASKENVHPWKNAQTCISVLLTVVSVSLLLTLYLFRLWSHDLF